MMDTAPTTAAPTSVPPADLSVGRDVDVEPRTWAGINKPGGRAQVTKIHFDPNNPSVAVRVDVKYVLGGREAGVELAYVRAHVELARDGRIRRRDVKMNVGSLGNSTPGKKRGGGRKQGGLNNEGNKSKKGSPMKKNEGGSRKKRKALADIDGNNTKAKSAKRGKVDEESSKKVEVVDTAGQSGANAYEKWTLIKDGKMADYTSVIDKGRRVSYWWSDEDGWLPGTVSKPLTRVVTKSTIRWTIKVDFENGDKHLLNFHPLEKRWKVLSAPMTLASKDKLKKLSSVKKPNKSSEVEKAPSKKPSKPVPTGDKEGKINPGDEKKLVGAGTNKIEDKEKKAKAASDNNTPFAKPHLGSAKSNPVQTKAIGTNPGQAQAATDQQKRRPTNLLIEATLQCKIKDEPYSTVAKSSSCSARSIITQPKAVKPNPIQHKAAAKPQKRQTANLPFFENLQSKVSYSTVTKSSSISANPNSTQSKAANSNRIQPKASTNPHQQQPTTLAFGVNLQSKIKQASSKMHTAKALSSRAVDTSLVSYSPNSILAVRAAHARGGPRANPSLSHFSTASIGYSPSFPPSKSNQGPPQETEEKRTSSAKSQVSLISPPSPGRSRNSLKVSAVCLNAETGTADAAKKSQESHEYSNSLKASGPTVMQGLYKIESDKAEKFVDYMTLSTSSRKSTEAAPPSSSDDDDDALELKVDQERMRLFNFILSDIMFRLRLDVMDIEEMIKKLNAHHQMPRPFTLLEIKPYLQKLHDDCRIFLVEDEGSMGVAYTI